MLLTNTSYFVSNIVVESVVSSYCIEVVSNGLLITAEDAQIIGRNTAFSRFPISNFQFLSIVIVVFQYTSIHNYLEL